MTSTSTASGGQQHLTPIVPTSRRPPQTSDASPRVRRQGAPGLERVRRGLDTHLQSHPANARAGSYPAAGSVVQPEQRGRDPRGRRRRRARPPAGTQLSARIRHSQLNGFLSSVAKRGHVSDGAPILNLITEHPKKLLASPIEAGMIDRALDDGMPEAGPEAGDF
jgi:hypothetical protein